jgi:hypothetical protein
MEGEEMAVQTERAFDMAEFKRAVESGWDVGALLPLYDEDAEYVTVDRNHPPSSPGVRKGRTAIGEYLKEAASNGVVSRIDHAVVSDDRAAVTFNCRYPNGTRVLCNSMLELQYGRIVRQTDVQAWDE